MFSDRLKNELVKKIFSLQYGFNSQSSSQGSLQSSSQEPKVYDTKQKNETDNNEKEDENSTISEFEECEKATQSTQDSSCYGWNNISQFLFEAEKKQKNVNLCNSCFSILVK